MKLLHLPVLAAICVAAPGIASAVTISSAAQLASALKAAKGGETFDLAPGNYGALLIQSRRFSTPVTFRSIDPSKPAVFSGQRSEEHTSELQSLMRISYAVFCLTKKTKVKTRINKPHNTH